MNLCRLIVGEGADLVACVAEALEAIRVREANRGAQAVREANRGAQAVRERCP